MPKEEQKPFPSIHWEHPSTLWWSKSALLNSHIPVIIVKKLSAHSNDEMVSQRAPRGGRSSKALLDHHTAGLWRLSFDEAASKLPWGAIPSQEKCQFSSEGRPELLEDLVPQWRGYPPTLWLRCSLTTRLNPAEAKKVATSESSLSTPSRIPGNPCASLTLLIHLSFQRAT